jgi:hypothetical protein
MRRLIHFTLLISLLLNVFSKDAVAQGPTYQSLFKDTDSLLVFESNYLPFALEAEELETRTEILALNPSDVELFRLRYRNESNDTIKGYLLFPYNEFTLIHNPQENRHFKTGSHIENQDMAVPNYRNLIPLNIPPLEVYEYQVVTGNFSGRAIYKGPIRFLRDDIFYQEQQLLIASRVNPIALDFIFFGAIGIFMLYTLFLYF